MASPSPTRLPHPDGIGARNDVSLVNEIAFSKVLRIDRTSTFG